MDRDMLRSGAAQKMVESGLSEQLLSRALFPEEAGSHGILGVLPQPAGESRDEKHLGAPGDRGSYPSLDHKESGSCHLSHKPQS